MSENHQLSRYFGKKKYLFHSETKDLDRWDPETSLDRLVSRHLRVFSIIREPQSTAAGRAVGMFTYILQDPMCHSVFSPQASSSFFPFIPGRLGINAALDAAIPCLCDIYGDIRRGKQISAATTHRYVLCLGALRSCVADPGLRKQSETICASLIIQICEVRTPLPPPLSVGDDADDSLLYQLMLDPGTGKYNALLTGSRSLIQSAGPERFRFGFERAMLELQKAPFVCSIYTPSKSSVTMDDLDLTIYFLRFRSPKIWRMRDSAFSRSRSGAVFRLLNPSMCYL